MNELPRGWILRPAGELFEFVTSGSRGWAQYYSDAGALFIRIGNLDHGTISLDLRDRQYVRPPANSEGVRTRLRADDVLISITAELGMVGLVPSDLGEAYVNQHLALARPAADLNARYLAWFFAENGKRQLLDMRRGMTKAGLGLDDIRKVSVLVPPLNEQRRIVSKLDAMFEQTRGVKARLKRLPPLLDKFKRSIIAAAYRGDLTAEWRAAHPAVEPASVLLHRVRSERHRRWQDAVRAKGRDPTKTKYSEPVSLADDVLKGLPVLPAGWSWASLDDVSQLVTGGTPPGKEAGCYADLSDTVGLPFMKPTDLDAGRNVTTARQHLTAAGADFLDVLPEDTVLITCIGATIGKVGLARVSCATNQQINAAVPICVGGEYLYWFVAGQNAQTWIRANASATTLPILNKGRLAGLPVPIAPLQEQARISELLNVAANHIDELNAAVERASGGLARVDQASLAKAFRGELVEQDPNDEPASTLLERLCAVVTPAKPARAERDVSPRSNPRATRSSRRTAHRP